MRTELQTSLTQVIQPVIALVEQEGLRDALTEAIAENADAIASIEALFQDLSAQPRTEEQLTLFFNSWKATHLKMLAIYGLCCRLQRMAEVAEGETALLLYKASSRNGETSYEDLGLDFDGHTHAALYNQMVAGFIDTDQWPLDKYTLAEAADFKEWIYRNMVVEDIQTGLFTNMFSEIYNHGEYAIALEGLGTYLEQYTALTEAEREHVLVYVNAHIEDDTELEHFKVVVDALRYYAAATGEPVDYAKGKAVFTEYLQRLGHIMKRLHAQMM